MTISGQTIFIIGGSSGIGLAAACRLAGLGANVAIFARRKDVLDAARDEILERRKDEGVSVRAYELDAAEFDAASSVLAAAASDLGTPDILINSAGGATPHRFLEMEAAQLAQTFAANVATTWNPCKVIAPLMAARGSGSIVNVSSLAGLIGVYGYTDYSLTKFGIVGFSEALRSELKPMGVSVQVFCPPDTETPGFNEENKTKPAETAALSAGAKLMTAEVVADRLIDGLKRNKFVVLANFESRLFWWLARFLPGVGRAYMDRVVGKAQAKSGVAKSGVKP